jgi:hypothetical protein
MKAEEARMVVFRASWPSIDRFTRSWQRRFRLSELLNNLGEQTIAVASDNQGVSANDDLLSLRMRALGFDTTEAAQFQPGIILDLHKSCVACESRAQCAADLKSANPEGDSSDAKIWQDYCPNVATLNMLSSLLPAMRVTTHSA